MDESIALAERGNGSGLEGLAGGYLTFSLGAEVFGIEILKVQEIIGIMAITMVPNTPEHVRGVINLRGKVIPVIELRLKFGMKPVPDTDRTCIIVVQVRGLEGPITIGVLVDRVSDVVHILGGQIETPPAFGMSVNAGAILGLGKLNERIVILLDVDKALALLDGPAVDTGPAE